MLTEVVMVAVLVVVFAALVSPAIRRSAGWSATVTPLASIIGSGFLVSVPLIAGAVGLWAVVAVLALTAFAYVVGGAIRYSIRYADEVPEGHAIGSFEVVSHLVLIGAYFISVAYYLALLATFGLTLVGVSDPLLGKVLATAVIVLVCGLGATRGLSGVQRAETYTVSANLAAIAALLVTLAIFGLSLPEGYSWGADLAPPPLDTDTVRFLLGLLIIVQGFETTRFMGQLYGPGERVGAMRRAQLVSTVVYVVFFLLMIPLYPFFSSSADVAGVIDVVQRAGPWLPYVVAAGAIASQFSASVADSIGASGLITETTGGRVDARHSYLLIGAVALLVTWTTDVVSVVALASRAFALFYALECLLAALLAHHRGDRGRTGWYALLGLACGAVAVLGIPAGG